MIPTRASFTAAAAAMMLTLSACAPAFQREAVEVVATDLPVGTWVAIDMPDSTMASDGSPYEIEVKRGASDNLIIMFGGGGAAWDASSAARPFSLEHIAEGHPGYYFGNISRFMPLMLRDGILDHEDEQNQFSDWTVVNIPYATGDFHVGDRGVEYELEDGASFMMHFNGYNNVTAALAWITREFPDPDRLLVTGSSAGGFGAALWFDRVARMYPDARLYHYSDSSYLYSEMAPEIVEEAWNAQLSARFGIEVTPNVTAAMLRPILERHPDSVILHSETIRDGVLSWYEAELSGVEVDADYRQGWSERMLGTMSALYSEYPNFHVYITDYGVDDEGKTEHTLSLSEAFTQTDEEGTSLAEWLAAAVIEDEPSSVGLYWLRTY